MKIFSSLVFLLAASSGYGQSLFQELRQGSVDPALGVKVARFASAKCELTVTYGRPRINPINTGIFSDGLNRPLFALQLRYRQGSSFKTSRAVLGLDSFGEGPVWLGLLPDREPAMRQYDWSAESYSYESSFSPRELSKRTHTVSTWFSEARNLLSATDEVKFEGKGRPLKQRVGLAPSKFLSTYSIALSPDRSQILDLRFTYSENESQKQLLDCGRFSKAPSSGAAQGPGQQIAETVDQRIQDGLEQGRIRLRKLGETGFTSALQDDVKVITTDGVLLVRPGETKFLDVNRVPEIQNGKEVIWFNGTSRQNTFFRISGDASSRTVLMLARAANGAVRWFHFQVEELP